MFISWLKGDTLENEIKKIKINYCSKCIYFDNKCTKNKIYKRCFKNNERVMKKENRGNDK